MFQQQPLHLSEFGTTTGTPEFRPPTPQIHHKTYGIPDSHAKTTDMTDVCITDVCRPELSLACSLFSTAQHI